MEVEIEQRLSSLERSKLGSGFVWLGIAALFLVGVPIATLTIPIHRDIEGARYRCYASEWRWFWKRPGQMECVRVDLIVPHPNAEK